MLAQLDRGQLLPPRHTVINLHILVGNALLHGAVVRFVLGEVVVTGGEKLESGRRGAVPLDGLEAGRMSRLLGLLGWQGCSFDALVCQIRRRKALRRRRLLQRQGLIQSVLAEEAVKYAVVLLQVQLPLEVTFLVRQGSGIRDPERVLLQPLLLHYYLQLVLSLLLRGPRGSRRLLATVHL